MSETAPGSVPRPVAVEGGSEFAVETAAESDLVLMALLFDAPQLTHSLWCDWVDAVGDIDDHTSIAFELFPAVYKALESADIEHPWRARLKGVFRRNWVNAQIQDDVSARAGEVLDRVGIEVIDSIDLQVAAKFEESAVFPRRSPRLTVRRGAAGKALNALVREDWSMVANGREMRWRDSLRRSEWELRSGAGESLLLSDHFHSRHPGDGADDEVWERARQGDTSPAFVVSDSDLLYGVFSEQGAAANSLLWALGAQRICVEATAPIRPPVPVLGNSAALGQFATRAEWLQLVANVDLTAWTFEELDVSGTDGALGLPSANWSRRARGVSRVLSRFGGIGGTVGYLRQAGQ